MPLPDFSETHVWVAASTVAISNRQVRRAHLRQSVRVPRDTRIMIEEIYCQQCRRPWEDVADELCQAAESSEHLRGGPIGVRAKRAHHKHNCAALGCPPRPIGGDGPGTAGAVVPIGVRPSSPPVGAVAAAAV